MQADLLYKSECILGEGAYWHAARESFYWVDIDGRTLWEYHLPARQVRRWEYERRISTIVTDEQHNLVLGAQGGLVRFRFDDEQFHPIMDIPPQHPRYRCNDGKCDPAGRLWIGVMCMDIPREPGALYCISGHRQPELKVSDVTISNGIVWTADQQWMYYTDTSTGIVQAYRYHKDTGAITFDRNAITLPPGQGSPDGMAIDEEGMLWVCHNGGHCVARWDPHKGRLLEKIDLPAPQVTSCAFGGPDRNLLLITTARENMQADQLKAYPHSGNVFIAQTKVSGPLLPAFKES